MTITIYDKYGGHDFFHNCIYSLYLDMFDHPEISYHFVGVNIETLSKNQTAYLIRAIGGPDMYKGRPLIDVHKHLDITPYQFKEIAKAFRKVFIDKGVTKDDVAVIMKFVMGHEKAIVTKRWSWIDRIMKPFYRLWKKLFE